MLFWSKNRIWLVSQAFSLFEMIYFSLSLNLLGIWKLLCHKCIEQSHKTCHAISLEKFKKNFEVKKCSEVKINCDFWVDKSSFYIACLFRIYIIYLFDKGKKSRMKWAWRLFRKDAVRVNRERERKTETNKEKEVKKVGNATNTAKNVTDSENRQTDK